MNDQTNKKKKTKTRTQPVSIKGPREHSHMHEQTEKKKPHSRATAIPVCKMERNAKRLCDEKRTRKIKSSQRKKDRAFFLCFVFYAIIFGICVHGILYVVLFVCMEALSKQERKGRKPVNFRQQLDDENHLGLRKLRIWWCAFFSCFARMNSRFQAERAKNGTQK